MQQSNRRSTSRPQLITRCALFAALSAVLSQIAIPIGPVPINLTHLSVFLSVGLLGMKYGTISQLVFVLMGGIGIPVFSNFGAGPGVLFGPTGGFIFGYLATALLTGWLLKRWGRSLPAISGAVALGWLPTYLLGIGWFCFSQQVSVAAALPLVFLPFLWGDLFKTVLSILLIHRLSPSLL